MTNRKEDDPAAERERAAFAAIVLLLRQLAQQLLEHGNAEEARGVVDGLDALQAKTRGNLDEGEARFLEDVLFELRMAVVRKPSAEPSDQGKGEDPEPKAE